MSGYFRIGYNEIKIYAELTWLWRSVMKILHTSDLHLGKRLHQHSLLEDQQFVLSQMVQLIHQEQPDLFVVAGDVFDRSLPPEDAMDLFGRWLAEIRECQPELQS